jgi:hypothetical protein
MLSACQPQHVGHSPSLASEVARDPGADVAALASEVATDPGADVTAEMPVPIALVASENTLVTSETKTEERIEPLGHVSMRGGHDCHETNAPIWALAAANAPRATKTVVKRMVIAQVWMPVTRELRR